ncbi:MAG: alginate lyase family protein [Opitutaceae bacterium]|nr:alginate lyase family protein [Opitutaceae bacterium]
MTRSLRSSAPPVFSGDRSPSLLLGPTAWDSFRADLIAHTRVRRQLESAAAPALKINRLTVVDKPVLPLSGDAHDYVSFGPYWWPDPDKADGLPYIRRDGETNPTSGGDRVALEQLAAALSTLGALARLGLSAEPARQAGRLLRGWFIDPSTRMNPHLTYAQGIPGHCVGRGIGIIDTSWFCFLLDEIAGLEFNSHWTPADLRAVKAWFSDYLDWLLESIEGQQECAEFNNHGTWYDAQVGCFALFCGRDHLARLQIEQFTFGRISSHIDADGRQPHELDRTLSLTYCTFNLLAFACIAQAARRLHLDLWNWTSPQNGSLIQAIRWLLPYYAGETPWTWPQLIPFKTARAALLLNLAADGTGDAAFSALSRRLSSHPLDRVSPWPLFS